MPRQDTPQSRLGLGCSSISHPCRRFLRFDSDHLESQRFSMCLFNCVFRLPKWYWKTGARYAKVPLPYRNLSKNSKTIRFKKFDALLTAWVKSKANIFNLEPQNQRPQRPQRPMPTGYEKIRKQTVVWSKLHQWIFHIAASIKHEPWFTRKEPFQTFVCCMDAHFSIRCFESNITIDETVWTVYWRGIIYIYINCMFFLSIQFFFIDSPSMKSKQLTDAWAQKFWNGLGCRLFPVARYCPWNQNTVTRPANFKCHFIFGTLTCATSIRVRCRWRATWWANLRIKES